MTRVLFTARKHPTPYTMLTLGTARATTDLYLTIDRKRPRGPFRNRTVFPTESLTVREYAIGPVALIIGTKKHKPTPRA